MTNLNQQDQLAVFRERLTGLKRETARVIAESQFAGHQDRKVRRELARRWEACKRRARVMERELISFRESAGGLDEAEQDEIERGLRFLNQLVAMGEAPSVMG